jgi:hypothetical protein
MTCLLKDDSDGTIYIAKKQDVESRILLTDGKDFFLVWEDVNPSDMDVEKTQGVWLSFAEMVLLVCFLGLVFFWLPAVFLFLRFLGFSVF